MDPTAAAAVINVAMAQGQGMFPLGAMPETDKAKVEEAEKLVALASQAKVVADTVGHGNVPQWPVAREVLIASGMPVEQVDAAAQAAPASAAPAAAPETPNAPAQVGGDATGGAVTQSAPAAPASAPSEAAPAQPQVVIGVVHVQARPSTNEVFFTHMPCEDQPHYQWMVPHDGMPLPEIGRPEECPRCSIQNIPIATSAYVPGEEPAAPAQPETPPAAAADPGSGVQVKTGRWLDANSNEWDIIRHEGGPELEARSVATGETTVLPAGLLLQPTAVQPQTQEQTPSSPPQQPPQQSQPSSSTSPASSPETVPTEPSPTPSTPSGAESPAPSSPSPQAAASSSPPSGSEQQLKSAQQQAAVAQAGLDQAREEAKADLGQQVPVSYDATSQFVQGPDGEPWRVPEGRSPQEYAAEINRSDAGDRACEQQLTVPIDDDEGDEKYGDLLERVTANYTPGAMPVPMELSRPPVPMPEDLTQVGDIQARALHSQFNTLASRARYLHGLEAAKARACDRVFKFNLKGAMREARQQLGKDASVTEVQQLAEDHEAVEPWIVRRDRHGDRAEAYKTFLSFYTEDVAVLSRDWTMRDKEEKGS